MTTSSMTLRQSLGSKPAGRKTFDLEHTRSLVGQVFGPDLHAMRVLSLANGVAGVLSAAVLSVHAIGQAYANLARITAKSGVKQIDRMLSNDGIWLDTVMRQWARFVVGDSGRAVIAIDWTDFEADDHTTLCAYLATSRHGRAMPLAWKTVQKSELKDARTDHELRMIERLHSWLPEEVEVTLLGDRAFGYQELYATLDVYGWDYALRFRSGILVESAEGERRPAEAWVPTNGRARMLTQARVTADRALVPAVVVVKRKNMKESWCIATSLTDDAAEVVNLYGRRFTIEETFRDTKDLHFGMGLSATHIKSADRRDRLLLLVAVAHALLTLLGAASEDSGLDRYLKVNTVKRRTHSLYRQGLYWYHAIPTMREEWLRRLMASFDRIVREHSFFSHFFEVK